MTYLIILAILAIVLGIIMRCYVAKKRFNRRTIGGMQMFSSYEKGVATTIFERIIKFVGTLLLIAGMIFLIMFWITNRQDQKAQQKAVQEQKV